MAYLDSKMIIHLAWKTQIASLIIKEIVILFEYLDNTDIFSKESAAELPKRSKINKHSIDLEPSKQPPYGPIYNLGPVEMETFKTYIETNLSNGFIRPSKSPAKAPILFIQKPDGSLHLCVDYRGFNNLIIKNQ